MAGKTTAFRPLPRSNTGLFASILRRHNKDRRLDWFRLCSGSRELGLRRNVLRPLLALAQSQLHVKEIAFWPRATRPLHLFNTDGEFYPKPKLTMKIMVLLAMAGRRLRAGSCLSAWVFVIFVTVFIRYFNLHLLDSAISNNMLLASAVVVWEWLSEHGRWRPYSPAVSHQIEAAIRSSDPRVGSVVLGQVDSRLSPYIIDLQSMHQFRQDTGKAKSVLGVMEEKRKKLQRNIINSGNICVINLINSQETFCLLPFSLCVSQ